MTNKKITNKYPINNMSVFDIFKTNLLFAIILVLIMGCKPSDELQIQSGSFIEGAECKQIEAMALKISSKDDFNAFTRKCLNKDIIKALDTLQIKDWSSNFIYLTKNYTLVEIRKYRQMVVQTAVLKKSKKGIGIYLINGDYHIPLKVTENIKPQNTEVSGP